MTRKQEITKRSDALAEQLDTARKTAAQLQKTVSEEAARLTTLKESYEQAVAVGASDTDLDAQDEEILKHQRTLTRAELKLAQCKSAIENLEQERQAALQAECEAEFQKGLDALAERFVWAEMSLSETAVRLRSVEADIREFTNVASVAGYPIHRMRISEIMHRFVSEKLHPTLTSRWNAERREQFARPLADVLEDHVRSALGMPKPDAPTVNAADKPEAQTVN